MPFTKKLVPWNKTESNSTCLQCGKVFHISPSKLKDEKIKRGLYCSKKCKDESKKGKPTWNSNLKGWIYKEHYKKGFGGTFYSSGRVFGGSIKEYMAIHHWVRKTLGKPSKCEVCGEEFSGKKIQWANKSKLYKKEVGDWIRMCVGCHYKYDKQDQRRNRCVENLQTNS